MVSLDTLEYSLRTSVLYDLVEEMCRLVCKYNLSIVCSVFLNDAQISLNPLVPLSQESNIFIYYSYN
jgi:hypothetical protein